MRTYCKALCALWLAALLLAGCAPGAPAQTGAAPGSASSAQGSDAKGEQPLPPLTLLMHSIFGTIDSERGFYAVDVLRNNTHQNLLFYDYEALEQRIVCDVAGCAHDTPSCTSYIDSFGACSAFSYGDSVYILYTLYEKGTDLFNGFAALEKCTLDGKDPEILFTWPRLYGTIQHVFTDGTYLYLYAVKRLMRVDMQSYAHETVATLPADTEARDDNGAMFFETYTRVLPASYQGQILYQRRNVDGSGDLLMLHPATGEETLLHSWPANSMVGGVSLPYTFTPEGKGYYVQYASGEIRCYDIATDTDTLVTDLYAGENTPYQRQQDAPYEGGEPYEVTMYPAQSMSLEGPYDGWLIITRNPTIGQDDSDSEVVTAYHLDTGTVSDEIPFRHYYNAGTRSAWIWGSTPHGLLVVNEVRPRILYGYGTGGEPIIIDSDYSVYSLIDVADYVAGTPNFRTIAPKVFAG